MQDTGRIKQTVSKTARRILFDHPDFADWTNASRLLHLSSKVDLAHVIMLVEQGMLSRERGRLLVHAIAHLQLQGFKPLQGRTPTRGMYLLYEDYLTEQLGPDIAGRLHIGRSRNDLNATVLRLQIRAPYLEMQRELLRLIAVMLSTARRHVNTVMPMYTHGQPAMPSTYGHYLSGVATALIRDVEVIGSSSQELCECPLGAGAGAGTTWPIDTSRTAALLGFSSTASHSLEAVASRNFVLRLMSAEAIAATTMSRIASDLRQWTTLEFGFFDLPDSVVGSSSAMPQKRNPFFLEHIQGKAGLVTGAFQAAIAAMCGTPFANCIAVGTEAVRPLWTAFDEVQRSAVLLRLMIASARPRPERMHSSAVAGNTTAILMADALVRDRGMDFRSAHAIVGRMISEAESARARPHAECDQETATDYGINIEQLQTDVVQAVTQLSYGNGPAPDCVRAAIESLRRLWSSLHRSWRVQCENWKRADQELDESIAVLSAPLNGSPARLSHLSASQGTENLAPTTPIAVEP
jgi:argininosuccinate lyase